MIKEYQLVDSRLDASHEFSGDFNCTVCGKPRCLHRLTGFKPVPTPEPGNPTPSIYPLDRAIPYRGPHPAWSRPGGFSSQEKAELYAEGKAHRIAVERAIAADKERFRLGQSGSSVK